VFFFPASQVAVYQFQEDDQPSDSFLSWTGDVRQTFEDVNSMTLCCRFRFFSIWEVSRFVQLTDEVTMEQSIQIGETYNLPFQKIGLASMFNGNS